MATAKKKAAKKSVGSVPTLDEQLKALIKIDDQMAALAAKTKVLQA